MTEPQLTIVGLGPGDPRLVTLAGVEVLREAQVIFVPQRGERESLALRICAPYIDQSRQRLIALPLVMERDHPEMAAAWELAAEAMAEALRPGLRGAYAMLGDPMLYGSFAPLQARLLARLPALALRFLPGITSLSAAAAATGQPLVSGEQRLALVPGMYETPEELGRLLDDFDSVAVLKAGPALPALVSALEPRRHELDVWLAERLGQPGERIRHGLDELAECQAGYFSLALITCKDVNGLAGTDDTEARTGTDGHGDVQPQQAQPEPAQPSMPNAQSSTAKPAMRDQQPATPQPEPETRNSKLETGKHLQRRTQNAEPRTGKVYIVGAGPGAPDLITLRGQAAIAAADAVLYADSLVMEAVTQWASPEARIVPTSGLALDQILELIQQVTQVGGTVARVHSGDPSLYGATHEQMRAFDQSGIDYEIIPGVTVAFAAAAQLRSELTIPELTQTIILTRVSGRATPVPETEALRGLAAHRASLAIYLAATRARQVQEDLLAGGYAPETPVAICYRVEWPDQQIVRCQLGQLAEQVRQHGFTRQVLMLVSPALEAAPEARSRLYDGEYSHRFRNQKTRQALPVPPRPHPGGASLAEQPRPAIVALTRAGSQLAARLAQQLDTHAYVPRRFAPTGLPALLPYDGSVVDLLRGRWAEERAFVLVMAAGIATRAIGPLLGDKRQDPAVVVCDEAGRAVISLAGGHLAGANALAELVADRTGGQAIVTTASDLQALPALDLLGRDQGWRIAEGSALTRAMAALVNGEPIALFDPLHQLDDSLLPEHVLRYDRLPESLPLDVAAALFVSERLPEPGWLERGVVYHPPLIYAGVGCRRGVAPEAIDAALRAACAQAGVAFAALAGIATAQIKADEPGLLAWVEQHDLPLLIYSAEELGAATIEGNFSPSAATARFDLPGVAEPCALLAAHASRLVQTKIVLGDVTVALARREEQTDGR